MVTATNTIEELAKQEYRYGFVTDIEADAIPAVMLAVALAYQGIGYPRQERYLMSDRFMPRQRFMSEFQHSEDRCSWRGCLAGHRRKDSGLETV